MFYFIKLDSLLVMNDLCFRSKIENLIGKQFIYNEANLRKN